MPKERVSMEGVVSSFENWSEANGYPSCPSFKQLSWRADEGQQSWAPP